MAFFETVPRDLFNIAAEQRHLNFHPVSFSVQVSPFQRNIPCCNFQNVLTCYQNVSVSSFPWNALSRISLAQSTTSNTLHLPSAFTLAPTAIQNFPPCRYRLPQRTTPLMASWPLRFHMPTHGLWDLRKQLYIKNVTLYAQGPTRK